MKISIKALIWNVVNYNFITKEEQEITLIALEKLKEKMVYIDGDQVEIKED